MALVLAYAFSPIDLIPDFIPVLGYLDDLLIVPLGIALVLKLIPAQVMADARRQAAEQSGKKTPAGLVGAIMVILIWLAILFLAAWLIARVFIRREASERFKTCRREIFLPLTRPGIVFTNVTADYLKVPAAAIS